MISIVEGACVAALIALSAVVLYQCVLAVAALLPPRKPCRTLDAGTTAFLVLIPAHNEEADLATTLRSLERVRYPADRTRVVVVADRCEDGTAAVARRHGIACLERRGGPCGKGAAIAWALNELAGTSYDAVVIVDADTVVDPHCLDAFEESLLAGQHVQQGYNYLSNPWDTPFTRIISVTSVLRNGLFYAGKERLGLPAMLTGTGMCFSRPVLERHRWSAFSVGEDWEFSVSLLLSGEQVHFNRRARVMARESSGLRQASAQRLRWASGRHAVAGSSATQLMKAAWRQRRFDLFDAALNIVAPTYSAQASLAGVCVAASWFVAHEGGWMFAVPWAVGLASLLAVYFFVGVCLTAAPMKAIVGIVLIPAFLPWRMAIEILGLAGFGRTRWGRARRAASTQLIGCETLPPKPY